MIGRPAPAPAYDGWFENLQTGWLFVSGGDWRGKLAQEQAGGVPTVKTQAEREHYLSVQDAQIRAMYDRYQKEARPAWVPWAIGVGALAVVLGSGYAVTRRRR